MLCNTCKNICKITYFVHTSCSLLYSMKTKQNKKHVDNKNLIAYIKYMQLNRRIIERLVDINTKLTALSVYKKAYYVKK